MPPILHPKICSTHADFFKTQLLDRQNNIGRLALKLGYNIYDGFEVVADKEKWGGNMTIIEYKSSTIKKSTGVCTSEKRLYASSLPADTPKLGAIVRNHWAIER